MDLFIPIIINGTFKLLITTANFHGAIFTKDMISALTLCFSILGTPEEVICDSGTQFTSKKYSKFSTQWGCALTTSSPHYLWGHSSNERLVQTIKKLFSKYDEDGSSHQIVFCKLRATPLHSKIPSPGGLLYRQQMTTTLQVIIKPPHSSEAYRASLWTRQDYSRYGAHTKQV